MSSVKASPVPILFVDHAPALGGAERSLLLLLRHLNSQRWRPQLACVTGELAARAQHVGLPIHLVSLPRLRRSARFPIDWLSGSRTLARIAREVDAAAIYANTVRAALYSGIAARLSRRPFVWHMRDFWLSETAPTWEFADRCAKYLIMSTATRVIANSAATAARLPLAQHVRVIHNGIDISAFDPLTPGAAFRDQNDIPREAPLVGMVGRLRPWKGQERFIRLATRVLEHNSDTYFAIVGGTPFSVQDEYATSLHEMVDRLGLARRVKFSGHLDDVRPALAAFDVFVHPGDPEPFGLVNVEAMAMSKPVVAFSHGALPEIVLDGETGILVPPVRLDAMARAIVHLLAMPDVRLSMGQAGRNRAATYFEIERVAHEVGSVLSDVIGERESADVRP